MELGDLVLISIFLFAIFTIGVVSAGDSLEIDDADTHSQNLATSLSEENALNDKEDMKLETHGIPEGVSQDFYNDSDDRLSLSPDDEKPLKGNDLDSSSWDFNAQIDKEYIYGSNIFLEFNPSHASNGTISILIDGVEFTNTTVCGEMKFHIPTSNLDIGVAHDMALIFSGDDNFEGKRLDASFNLVNYIVDIPENACYNNLDRIRVLLGKDTTGYLTMYADENQIRKLNVAKDFYYYEDSQVLSFEYDIDDLNLPLDNHTVRVVYSGNKQGFDVSKTISLGYAIRITEFECHFNSYENFVCIDLPRDAKGTFSIMIDGNVYDRYEQYIDYWSNYILVEVSVVGKHEISITYNGDGKYYYPLTANGTFSIIPYIKIPIYDCVYKSDDEYVTLMLPRDATGNLVVEVNGEIYAKKPMINGNAGVSFENLSLGTYDLKAYYDSEDYNVSAVENQINVSPRILMNPEYDFDYTQSIEVYLYLPEDACGTLRAILDGDVYLANMTGGLAKIAFSSLDLGYHSLHADYFGDDMYSVDSEGYDFQVSPILKISKDWVVFGKNTITVFTPLSFRGGLGVEVGGRFLYVDIVNGTATISVPVISSGDNFVSIDVFSEKGYSLYYLETSIHVTKASSPKMFAESANVYYGNSYKVNVYNIYGKALKNARVSFTIGKKTYVKYTDSRGVASLKMDYKPKTYSVTVKYSKQKIKVKVTVKHVVNLKKVKIRKSAKRLVLSATLKKGNTLLKGKKITFKFKGIKYVAKTNKKGIAKVTVKKSVLKKLKTGKKVTYQATYMKDTVKVKVKIQP